ncbi:MAG: YtxH domain-containing protein [Anaerolineae bacterium]|nr:YtxH domain-containing protein [Anaerolineae bacterium]
MLEVICGGLIGLIAGAAAALWWLPKSGKRLRDEAAEAVESAGRELRSRAESVVPTDPIAESLAEGKAAARRRLRELGLDGE